jgi:DNA invertase Pin-like site-specific DNA recombinase
MNGEQHRKLKAHHLARDAYLYVRQATACQGFEKANSLQRQYDLRQQAVALGWAAERVIVIDSDMGQSGASAAGRRGFQELMRQIRRGRVGVVMALDPSRWTRNFLDWRRLLDACVMSDTLLLDQDGLYDLADFADRVLLGCEQMMPGRKRLELTSQHKEVLT